MSDDYEEIKKINLVKFAFSNELDAGYQTLERCRIVLKIKPDYLVHVNDQTPEICLLALNNSWTMEVYEMITIPIEGELLKGINKLKLLNGPLQ